MKKLLLLILLMSIASFAAGENAEEIAKKAHLQAYYTANDGSSQMAMLVYPEKGNPIKKVFTMLKLDIEEGGKQRFFIFFQQPADIQKTTFLVHKHVEEDDYRRLYLPASDKVVPIAGSRKQDPFMGSDFSYEDVSGRHFSKDKHSLLGTETLTIQEKKGSQTYQVYVLESTPKEEDPKISKMKSWIDKKTHLPIKVEFYNHDGKLFKTFESQQIREIQGHATIMRRTMTSPLLGTKTVILLNPKKTLYDVGLSESVFEDRSLRNPPMKYLK